MYIYLGQGNYIIEIIDVSVWSDKSSYI